MNIWSYDGLSDGVKSVHEIRKCVAADFDQFIGISEEDQTFLDDYVDDAYCIDKPEEIELFESADKWELQISARWCGLDETPRATCVDEKVA